jgi:hypothetical protein
VSEEKIRPNPMMAGFDALQEALKPLVELVRFISKPETGIAIRQTLEDLERHWREEDQSFINFTVTHRWLGLERHMTSEQLRLLIRVSEANGPGVANQMVPKYSDQRRSKRWSPRGAPFRIFGHDP